MSSPWTGDRVLQRHRFTNAYRASDRVSQYLIRHVIYSGLQVPEEVVFRTLLFKVFNRIETWELLQSALGGVSWASYRYEAYDRILSGTLEAGGRIYSAAYIMPSSAEGLRSRRKHQNHLRLLERLMRDGFPGELARIRHLRDLFVLLRSYPLLGDFLAYQFTIDLNYTDLIDFSENDFVVPGPGARSGLRKCFSNFGGLSEVDLIRLVTEHQAEETQRLRTEFLDLWGRPLHLVDCQNLFCEVDKYARVIHPEVEGLSGRQRIKQVFRGNHASPSVPPWFPPKWGLNERISNSRGVPTDEGFRRKLR